MTPNIRRVAALGAALMLAGGRLAAQGPDPFAGHTYQPGIDVLDYDITLDLPDTGSMIRGDVTVTARRAAWHEQSAPRPRSRASPFAQVQLNGTDVDITRTDNAFDVPLIGATGDSVQVRVRYDGEVRDGLIVRKDARAVDLVRRQLAEPRAPLDSEHRSSERQGDGHLARTAPRRATVVANGTLVGTRPLDAAACRARRDACGASRSRFRRT